LHCVYHYEKWYVEKLKEEMEWEDQVAKEVAEAAGSQPEAVAAD